MPVGGSSARAIEAGGAFVRLFTRNGDLLKGLDHARAKVRALAGWFSKQGGVMLGFGGKQAMGAVDKIGRVFKGGALAGLAGGAGTLGILGKALFGSLDHAAEMQRYADKLGETTDRLSAFAYAAETTGVTFEELADDFENWPERLSEAASGTGEAAEAFAKLNLSAQELARIKELPITEQMIELSGAMQGTLNETDRLMLLGKFFSDKGQFLNQLFKQGPAGIRGLMAQAVDVGAVVDPKQTKEMAESAKIINTAWAAVKNTFLAIGAALLPPKERLEEIGRTIVNTVKTIREWVSENGTMIQIAAGVAAAIAGVSAAFLIAGPAISGFVTMAAIPAQIAVAALAAGAGLLASAMGIAGSAVAATMGLIGTAITATISGAALLFSPAGLLTAGVLWATGTLGDLGAVIGGVADALGALPQAVRSTLGILGSLGDSFAASLSKPLRDFGSLFGRTMESAKEVALQSWGGIATALKRGDLAAAGGIAVDALKVVWLRAKPELESIWEEAKKGLGGIWDKLVLDIKEAWKGVHTSIQETLAEVRQIVASIMSIIEFVKSARGNGVDVANLRNSKAWDIGTKIAAPGVALTTGYFERQANKGSGPTLTPGMAERSRRADELRREAIRRGMTEQQADSIANGIMKTPSPQQQGPVIQGGAKVQGGATVQGGARVFTGAKPKPPEIADPEGAKALAELERRRKEGIEVQRKYTDEQAKALDSILKSAGDVLGDAAKKWAELRGGVQKRIPEAQDILKAEEGLRKRLAGEAMDSIINKAGRAWDDVRNGIKNMIPDKAAIDRNRKLTTAGEELSSTVKGLFQAGDARMSLGIGDKVMVDATKSTAKNTATTAKKAEEMADTLVDIRDELKDANRWA